MKSLIGCVALLSTATMIATPVLAQNAAAQRTYHLDIPAQALDKALLQFAEATGLQLIYSSQVARGLKSPGVRGEISAQAGLQRLLSQTELMFRITDSGAIMIDSARKETKTRVMGPVRVEGSAGNTGSNGISGSRDVTATEGTGSFTTGAMTIGSKSPRSLKDTPQSVSVLTHEQIEQQNINDFTQALAQAPGISLAQGATNLETTFYSRGYEITSIQIDGGAPLTTRFADISSIGYFPQIDLSQYDHIEVLRGAAGLFNGYGDPSGTINLVRKKPLNHEQVSVDGEWGSWNHYRTVLDATAPLAFDGKLRGRMIATWQSNEQFYEVAEDRKTLLYGVLDYDLTPTTLITAGISQTNQDSTPWYNGLPRYQTGEDLDLPRETALAFPWNRWSIDTTEIFGLLEQQIGEDWTAKLNLTGNKQAGTRKIGYSQGAVNPIDGRGPRLYGIYADYASEQLSAEATVSGRFTLFGQRQEMTLGFNRSDQDAGGQNGYASLISSSAAAPYQPYPNGPRFCTDVSVCPLGIASPPIDVFSFDGLDRLYTEPANPLLSNRTLERGQVQTLAYANLRLTAFDRLHLDTGLRWSRYERKLAQDQICTSIPASGTPSATNCVGREIGDAYRPTRSFYSGETLSWPPSVSLSYDVTRNLVGYLGYTDIYVDQSDKLDGDLDALEPITGGNIELGLKWAIPESKLNMSVAVYRIKRDGYAQQESNILARYKRNPNGSLFVDQNGTAYLIANDGTELPNGMLDQYYSCCYVLRNGSNLVTGADTELAGEMLPGWQIAASYTYSKTKQEGDYFGASEGLPFTTIQPEHLYKLWTSYDFGAAGATGWLSNLSLSVGINGQSNGYRSGKACPANQVGPPNQLTGESPCLVAQVPFEFTVEAYTLVSGRIDYKFNDQWSFALNLQNIFDETYYQSVGDDPSRGNWYGSPRSFTLSLRSKF